MAIIVGVSEEAQVSELIRESIRHDGPMTFAEYMNLALYHPQLGYYATGDRFGAAGDFYTAEQLQPVFGEVVASFVEKITVASNEDRATYRVLEIGAGRGEMEAALRKWSYRPFDLRTAPLPSCYEGLVLANEFFDALPCHVLRRTEDGWVERYITLGERDVLRVTDGALSTAELSDYAERYGSAVPVGGQLEACLELKAWCRRLGRMLVRGDLLVIDYGYHAPRELVRFPQGTVLSYRRHQASSNPLDRPGAQDITAHVNFTWLAECAGGAGFTLQQSQTLGAWVLSVWDEPRLSARWTQATERWRLQFKQLVFGLGETFRVLHFAK